MGTEKCIWERNVDCVGALTTVDGVGGHVVDQVASGEHCTQAQNNDGVNSECVAHVLEVKYALQEEPDENMNLRMICAQRSKESMGTFTNLPVHRTQEDHSKDKRADHWIRYSSFVLEDYAKVHNSYQKSPPGKQGQATLSLSHRQRHRHNQ